MVTYYINYFFFKNIYTVYVIENGAIPHVDAPPEKLPLQETLVYIYNLLSELSNLINPCFEVPLSTTSVDGPNFKSALGLYPTGKAS